MNSTDDANDMDGMGGMVNAGATDGVECWETARANHDFSSRHGHALAGMLGPVDCPMRRITVKTIMRRFGKQTSIWWPRG